MISKLEDQLFGSVKVDYPDRDRESSETDPRHDIYLGPSREKIEEIIAVRKEQEPRARYGVLHTFRLTAAHALFELSKLNLENNNIYYEVTSGLRAYDVNVAHHAAVYLWNVRGGEFLGIKLK
ncbi:hypothetical protein HYT51_02880 [Candidatus Woesearchaeota archaeon]|nr:hypothetical protein [Candidatus Woesearchaeota archaeon]